MARKDVLPVVRYTLAATMIAGGVCQTSPLPLPTNTPWPSAGMRSDSAASGLRGED
jgi:hypothetical protein